MHINNGMSGCGVSVAGFVLFLAVGLVCLAF